MSTTTRLSFALAVIAAISGCSVQKTTAPDMTGVSELALRLAMQVTPDSILQDGFSQAVLIIDASGPDNRPIRGLALRVEVQFDGIIQDFGTLSAKTVVTGEDGRARVTYTAPARPSEPVEQGNLITFLVVPIGNDYVGEVHRSVGLRLVTPAVLLPPNSAPQAAFSFTPEAALPLTDIIFDASQTTDEGAPCGAACVYRWDFGDGETGTGIFVRHQYRTQGNYQVKLTVVDARGASSTLARAITIGALATPTAEFSFSPTNPVGGQTIFFNAEASRPADGRQLVSYEWDFGSGRSGTGVTISKGYDTPGSYTVTLKVTDDAGATATVSRTVTVAAGAAPVASFTFSPTNPIIYQQIFFTAESSRGVNGKSIVRYDWNFGNGRTATGITQTNQYFVNGSYTVTLTVTDDAGIKGTSSQVVSVGQAAPVTASLTLSPTNGTVNTVFVFDASASTTAPGASIVEYHFVFGDNTPDQIETLPRATHHFTAPGTYVVSVTVKDSAGRTGVARVNVTVNP